MNQATKTIRNAADLHNYLKANKNFDFNPDRGRDAALYKELKRSLDLPDGSFLTALRARNVSAKQYLRALMMAAEPLAEMYKEILAYCARANFLRSREGAKIEWEIASADEQIGFSPEAFRLFDEIKTSVEPSPELMFRTKNEIMNWLARDVFGPDHKGLPRKDLNWKGVEIFRILANARDRYGPDQAGIFRGLNNYYLGGTGERPSAQLISRVTSHPDYPAKLSAVAKAFDPDAIELVASEFIELPFWKFRWQIYEIWVIAVSLSEFAQFGFQLAVNHDGRSLIELGREATLATHVGNSSTFIYQPTYRNRSDVDMRPDIVVSSVAQATPDDVRLIIECKQRISLEVQHVEDVRKKYEAGVDASIGEVVIVNYDDAPPWSNSDQSKTTLIGNVRPKLEGEKEFRRFLRTSRIAKSLRKEAWFVDISLSMRETLDDDFRRLLVARRDSLRSGSFELYGFAQEVEPRQPSDLQGVVGMSTSRDDSNWEGHGITQLCIKVRECLTDKSLRLFIVSDIASKIESQLSIGNDKPDRVRFIDPKQKRVLEVIAGNAWGTDALDALDRGH
ncbi:hypothetical protein ACI2TO_22540 [Ralstonia nicotianae]